MQALYLEDPYLKEFESVVKSVKDDKFIVLEQTAFYPVSGGQPYDTGKFVKDNEEFNVVFVGKFSGEISHEVDRPGLKQGDKIKGFIDWDRRYTFMRYHTASHVFSGVIHKETNCVITGNQIGLDRTRVDFNLESFDREKLNDYEQKANGIIKQNLPVNLYFISREEADKDPDLFRLTKELDPSIKEIRVVEIEGFDKQACGGCHLRNTSEIGTIKIEKVDNKGKNNRRVYFSLS